MSFGYALERPEARGGKENITLNILVHQHLFPLVNQFLDEVQEIHLLMSTQGSEKEKIREKVVWLRNYVSLIILAYERIYHTTELIIDKS